MWLINKWIAVDTRAADPTAPHQLLEGRIYMSQAAATLKTQMIAHNWRISLDVVQRLLNINKDMPVANLEFIFKNKTTDFWPLFWFSDNPNAQQTIPLPHILPRQTQTRSNAHYHQYAIIADPRESRSWPTTTEYYPIKHSRVHSWIPQWMILMC